jgi:predicted TIM-barrel fold metal-dependent hydrolase
MGRHAIDMHCHPLPEKYFRYITETGKILQDKCPFYEWNEDLTLDFMDRAEIERAVLWISSPSVHSGNDADARRIIRELNEEMTDLQKRKPDRITYFALLPLPDVTGAVEEVRYAADVLGAKGFTLNSNFDGLYMGNPAMDPVLAEMDARGSVVTLHPTRPSAIPEGVLDAMPIPMLEFMFDSTRMLVNMMQEKTLSKFPNIRFVVPHCGGTLPWLIDRLVQTARKSGVYDGYEQLRKFHFDIAGGSLPRQLPLLLSLVGDDRILYGSDWGFKNVEECLGKLKDIDEFEGLTSTQREKIYHENAERLLGL